MNTDKIEQQVNKLGIKNPSALKTFTFWPGFLSGLYARFIIAQATKFCPLSPEAVLLTKRNDP